MNLLLDTHILLWALGSPDRLWPELRASLEDPDNTVFVSAVSAWEIEIKRALGKLRAPEDVGARFKEARFIELPLCVRHVQEITHLPDLHKDPFDRMLIAQAQADRLILATRDENIRRYPVETFPV